MRVKDFSRRCSTRKTIAVCKKTTTDSGRGADWNVLQNEVMKERRQHTIGDIKGQFTIEESRKVKYTAGQERTVIYFRTKYNMRKISTLHGNEIKRS